MATVQATPLADLSNLQSGLVARLAGVRRRVRVQLFVEGLAIVLAEAAAAALFMFWADHTFRLGMAARMVILVITAAGLIFEFGRRVVVPLFMPLGLVALAGAIGRKAGDDGDLAARVASVLEL